MAGKYDKILGAYREKDTGSNGGCVWGEITGNISDQLDLQNALDWKANVNLSNLTSTSINASLIPNTSLTYDLGATNKAWNNLFTGTIYLPFQNQTNRNIYAYTTTDEPKDYLIFKTSDLAVRNLEVDLYTGGASVVIKSPQSSFLYLVQKDNAFLELGQGTLVWSSRYLGGSFYPDKLCDLGKSSYYWRDLYIKKIYFNSANIDGYTSGLISITGNVSISGTLNNHTIPSGSGTFALTSDLANYVAKTGNETINGIKTFTSFPIGPSTIPTSDYQFANKYYVDQSVLGLQWRDPVLDMDRTSPPSSPTTGDRYQISSAGHNAIVFVEPGMGYFSVDGDQTSHYSAGDVILVRRSTGNNGWYTVNNVMYIPPNTDIYVNEEIPSGIADGYIHYSSGAWRAIGVGKLVTWNGSSWVSDGTPQDNWATFSIDDGKQWRFGKNTIETYSWAQIGTALTYTFENGLTLSGSNVKLGGDLSENTTLNLGGYNFVFNLNGSGKVGINTNNPNSYLDIRGSKSEAITLVNKNITLDETHHTVLVDASSSSSLTINLPDATDISGREYTIKKVDSNPMSSVVITPYGFQTIDGANSYILTSRFEWVTIKAYNDGVSTPYWRITGKSAVSSHALTHKSGGSDAIKLDELAPPDDNTNLNASTSAHGLLRKLDGNPNHYLNGQGEWTTPGAGNFAPIDAQYLTLALDETLTNERVLTPGNRLSLTDTGANGSAKLEVEPSYKYIIYEDEFTSGLTSSGNIGKLGWVLGAGSVSAKAGETSHPGILTLSSGTTSGTIARLLLTTGTVLSWYPSDVSYLALIVRPVSGTTTMSVRFGLSNSVSTSGEGAQGIYWSFQATTSPNWRTITKGASGTTANTTTTAYTTGKWYLLEIKRNGSNWEFYLNNTLQFIHSTNIPTVACIPFIAIETNEAVAKTMDVDYFALKSINPLGQRYTS